MEKTIIAKPGGRERIEIGITEFKGKQYLDIRNFYNDGTDWMPSPKGVSIPVELAKKVSRAVRQQGEPFFDVVTESVEPTSKTTGKKAVAAPARPKIKVKTKTRLDPEDRPDPVRTKKLIKKSSKTSNSY